MQKKTIEKINGTENWFFEKFNTIGKLPARRIKKILERRHTQSSIRNERGDITIDPTDIERIIREG